MFGPSGHYKRVGASRIGKVTGQKLYQRIEGLLSIDSNDMIVAATVLGGTGANREWNLVGAFWG